MRIKEQTHRWPGPLGGRDSHYSCWIHIICSKERVFWIYSVTKLQHCLSYVALLKYAGFFQLKTNLQNTWKGNKTMCNFIFHVQLDTKYHYYCCMPFRSNHTCIQICDANYLGNCKVGTELLMHISRLIMDNHINTNISSEHCINNQAGIWILDRISDGWANMPCLASISKLFNSWTQVIKDGKWVMFSFDHLSLANLQKLSEGVAVQAVKHRLLLVEKANTHELCKLCSVLSRWFCISVSLPIHSVDVVI